MKKFKLKEDNCMPDFKENYMVFEAIQLTKENRVEATIFSTPVFNWIGAEKSGETIMEIQIKENKFFVKEGDWIVKNSYGTFLNPKSQREFENNFESI